MTGMQYTYSESPGSIFKITVPDKLMQGGQARTMTMENKSSKILVDYMVPTNGKIAERRPDVTVYIKSKRKM